MKSTHFGKAKKLLLSGGLVASSLGAVAVVMAMSVPTVAYADTTSSCYPATSCAPPTTAPPSSSTGGSAQQVQPSTAAASSSLPFTGADIEQLAAIGGGAILIGAVLVRRSRRRAHAAAAVAPVPGLVLAEKTVWSQWRSGSPTTRG